MCECSPGCRGRQRTSWRGRRRPCSPLPPRRGRVKRHRLDPAKRRSKPVPDTAAVKAGTPLRGCSLDSACANGGYTRHSMSDAAKRPWAIPPSPIAWPWVTTVGRPCDGRQRGRLGPAVSDARASPGDGRQRGRLETASETAVFGCSRQPRRLGLTRAVCAASPVWKLLGPARSMDQPAAWARQSSHPDSVP